MENILGSVGHRACCKYSSLPWGVKAAEDNTETDGRGCVSISRYLQKQTMAVICGLLGQVPATLLSHISEGWDLE